MHGLKVYQMIENYLMFLNNEHQMVLNGHSVLPYNLTHSQNPEIKK